MTNTTPPSPALDPVPDATALPKKKAKPGESWKGQETQVLPQNRLPIVRPMLPIPINFLE